MHFYERFAGLFIDLLRWKAYIILPILTTSRVHYKGWENVLFGGEETVKQGYWQNHFFVGKNDFYDSEAPKYVAIGVSLGLTVFILGFIIYFLRKRTVDLRTLGQSAPEAKVSSRTGRVNHQVGWYSFPVVIYI